MGAVPGGTPKTFWLPERVTLIKNIEKSNSPVCHQGRLSPEIQTCAARAAGCNCYTEKKENQTFLIFREIQSGAVAKSYMRKGFLIL
jgi:hypothetical protein